MNNNKNNNLFESGCKLLEYLVEVKNEEELEKMENIDNLKHLASIKLLNNEADNTNSDPLIEFKLIYPNKFDKSIPVNYLNKVNTTIPYIFQLVECFREKINATTVYFVGIMKPNEITNIYLKI